MCWGDGSIWQLSRTVMGWESVSSVPPQCHSDYCIHQILDSFLSTVRIRKGGHGILLVTSVFSFSTWETEDYRMLMVNLGDTVSSRLD